MVNCYNYSEEKDIILIPQVIMQKSNKVIKLPYVEPTKAEKRRLYGDDLYNWLFTMGAPVDHRLWREVGEGQRASRNLLPSYMEDDDADKF